MTMDQVVTDYAKLVYSLVAKFKNYYDVEDLNFLRLRTRISKGKS